ncbi:chemotaxis protein [Kyrpidia spormannii]|uniref:Chemotaxis protein n=1 Tax=Kyrpidia spormannii TaxID=2055160 RepID=A0A2K8N901_9BACL|nr:methyl-accepting chemotaxis protein [Kyrpidia spormannii]ATY85297.1 chemotaxis protein [Kyrpidia spormannii]
MIDRAKWRGKGPQEPTRTGKKLEIQSSPEVTDQLTFLHLSARDLETVRALKSDIKAVVHEVAAEHYDRIEEIPELQAIMDRHSNREQLTGTFVHYFTNLFSIEDFDDNFVKTRRAIGRIHSQVHLPAKWYIASYIRLYEHLIPRLVHSHSRKPDQLADILLSVLKVISFDMQLILEAYEEETEFRFIDHISGIMESILKIDGTANILEASATSKNHAEGISAAAEQLTASIREVAQQASRVADYSDQVIHHVESGRRVIQESLQGMTDLGESFKAAREKIVGLSNAAEDISHIASLIRKIADQTNLLALNAAIEAARAGDHGRGFAVVASEVRTLADQTKESIHRIAGTVEQVQRETRAVRELADQVVDNLGLRVAQSRDALRTLEEIVSQVGHMAEFFNEVAATTEEQAAATDDIALRIDHVLGDVARTDDEANRIGNQIHETSVQANRLRLELIGNIPRLEDAQLVRVVITEHLLWKWWLYNMILGYHVIDEKELLDHRRCRLGQWYEQARNRTPLSSMDSFRAIEEPHIQVHRLAEEIHRLIRAGETVKARSRLADLERASQKVVGHLRQLLQDLKTGKAQTLHAAVSGADTR